jgi:hypothetical protein
MNESSFLGPDDCPLEAGESNIDLRGEQTTCLAV